MLNVDTSRPLRSHRHLHDLVAAVVGASPNDETDWVEWKTHIDLSAHEGQGTIARHILGLANRSPEQADKVAGGCGYLVVGAAPGSAEGIPELDPADLEPRVQQFLDPDVGPIWQAHWVNPEPTTPGHAVLVVVVDPPLSGHPIHTLQKQFDKYGPGDIFVRRPGRTDKADPADVRRLTARAMPTAGRGLSVHVQADDGEAPVITPLDTSTAAIDPWLERQRDDLLRPMKAQTQARAHRLGGVLDDFMQQQRDVERMFTGDIIEKEKRSPDQFQDEVEKYIAELAAVAHDLALPEHIEHGQTFINLCVVNDTDVPFADVAVTLHFPGEGVAAFDRPPWPPEMPRRPRPWGDRTRNRFAIADRLGALHALAPEPPRVIAPRPSIDNSGSATIRFPGVDVLPQDRSALDAIHLLVPADMAGRQLEASWEARSAGTHGVVRGTLTIDVAQEAALAHELLTAAEDDE